MPADSEIDMREPMSKRMVIGFILCIAAGLRLLGWQQGYPDFYGHVDEVGVAASVWNFFREATLRPTEFTYPALYSYLVAAGVAMTGVVVAPPLAGGGFFDRLVLLSYTDPAWSALVGRGISVISDLIHISLIYQLSRRVGAGKWAWFAALAYAVAVTPSRQAHMALPDATVAMLSTYVVYRAWLIVEGQGHWRDYLVAGAICGLVLATKYNGALCALAVVAAHMQRHPAIPFWRRCLQWRLWGAGGVAIGFAVIACPYFVLASEQYFGLARYQLSSLEFSLQETSPWWWIPRAWVLQEFVLGGLLLAGIVWGAARRDRFDWLLLIVVVPAFLYIGSWTRESLHYLLPYLGLMIVQVARMWALTAERFSTVPAAGPIVLALIVLLPNGLSTWHNGWQLQKVDTRTLAATWIKQQIPDGAGIGMTWLPYCPRLPSVTARTGLEAAYGSASAATRLLSQSGALYPAYQIVNLEIWLKEPVVPPALREHIDLTDRETRRVFSRGWRSPRQLRRLGVDYLVLPDGAYARYMQGSAQPTSVAAQFRQQVNRAYFERLLDPTVSEVVAVFSSGDNARGGEIRVLRLRSAPDPSM